MNAKMIIGICLVVFIVAGLIVLLPEEHESNGQGRHPSKGALPIP